MSEKIAIIGGGMLGLTLALRLAQAGKKVTVFEGASELGGLAAAWTLGDIVWDKHYHVTLLSDTALRKVLSEIGLENELEWRETKTGFYTDGKLVSMSNTLEFLRFPPLDIVSKLRLGATIFYASKINDWQKLENILIADWLTQFSGKRTFKKIWLPLLRAKLGESYRETSAAFIWATIQRMYAARKTGLKKEMFGYVRGGYAKVLQNFGRKLEELGVEIKLNTRVESVEKQLNGKIFLKVSEGDRHHSIGLSRQAQPYGKTAIEVATLKESNINLLALPNEETVFDKAVLTLPSNIAAKICPQLTDEEKLKLNAIRYQGIVCASLLLKKPISESYVTNITDEAPFTAVIEMSALVDNKEFGGNSLIYLPKYVAPGDELFEKSDAEIKENFVSALEKMYSHFNRADVLSFQVSRVRQVFALSTIGYSTNLLPMQTTVDNVYIVNSTHIVNGTLNVNETVQLAERAAREFFC